ncbi:MAG TPA: transketolase C-terminal domain-containing protein [Polyangiaceae bacterium]|nr:transketolase C-terminal domain-containing protein [Polyangiaceae bacterium]
MGDLIGSAVDGTLYWIGAPELRRLRELHVAPAARAQLLADACRLNALYMIARAGSGHIGSSFSSLDVVTWLHLEELSRHGGEDVYFSSKGHDAPGLYALLIALEQLPFDSIHRLRQLDGLPGHPDIGTPGIVTNTGSLGMGISKAKGMVLANRYLKTPGRVYVMTGDGELQEGQIWESLLSAANLQLHEICAIVDHNKLQSDTFVERTSSLGDLEAKFKSFGFYVERVNGHDFEELAAALWRCQQVKSRPQLIIADTIKGKGVSFMEHTSLDSDVAQYRFHSGAPNTALYRQAVEELLTRLHRQTQELGLLKLQVEHAQAPERAAAGSPQKLVPAYAKALELEMQRTANLVVLDADLVVDTGQMPARERRPERFVECGIAEMDMVSMAGGLALKGMLPVCHSFACFLSTRANEQIYNNGTERTHVVYVASLAGLLPAGPGHSHQAVRDISAIGAIQGLVAISPSSEAEVGRALAWCLHEHDGPAWLRLESIPCEVPFQLPDAPLELGVGTLLREGVDGLFIGYGPTLLSEAWRAAEALEEDGLRVGVMNLPWLNQLSAPWLLRALDGIKHVFSLDNHHASGGQGDRIADVLAAASGAKLPRLHRFAVEGLPTCGSPSDVLHRHGLDTWSLRQRVLKVLSAPRAQPQAFPKSFEADTGL